MGPRLYEDSSKNPRVRQNDGFFKMAPASNFPEPLRKMEAETKKTLDDSSSKPPFLGFHDGKFPEGIFLENVIMFQVSCSSTL